MEDWQRKRIVTNLPRLLRETKLDGIFLTYFSSEGVLSENDVDGIQSIPNRTQQIMEFYKMIQTRVNAYDLLIKALGETNQTGTLKILEGSIGGQTSATQAPPTNPPVYNQAPEPVKQELPVQKSVSEPDFARGRVARDITAEDKVDFKNSMEPLNVYVTKPGTRMAFSDDYYKLGEGFKGYSLVLNITEFYEKSMNRGGAKHDTGYMTNLWSSLGYEVTTKKELFTHKDVLKILEGEFSTTQSSDHQSINLYKHVIYNFDSERCEELIGKPKIFIIQACQRFQTDAVADRREVDANLKTPIDHAIVCFSTIPGYVSNRDLYLGTWYTYCLTKVFMDEAHHMPLVKMLELTQDCMQNIIADAPKGQLSAFFHLGIKTLYFNMPPSSE